MKVRVWLSIGFASPCTQRGEIEIPDEDLEGLDERWRDKVIHDYVQDWADNYIEFGWGPEDE